MLESFTNLELWGSGLGGLVLLIGTMRLIFGESHGFWHSVAELLLLDLLLEFILVLLEILADSH